MECNTSTSGRLAATFLFVMACLDCFANELLVKNEFSINDGILADKYWSSQDLQKTNKNISAYSTLVKKAQFDAFNTQLFIEQQTISTLVSNRSTLILADRNQLDSSMITNGTIPISATVKKYSFEAIGFTKSDEWTLTGVRLVVSPKLLKLTNVNFGSGSGLLTKTDSSLSVNGSLNRQGISSYGFDANPSSLNLGAGITTDLEASYSINNFHLSFQSYNLWSRVLVDGLFYNNLNVQVNTTAKGITYSDVPSLTGNYGQLNSTLALPQIKKWEMAYGDQLKSFLYKVGVIQFQGGSYAWTGFSYLTGDQEFELKTNQLNNLFLTYEIKNLLAKGLSLSVTSSSDLRASSKTALTSIRYSF